MKLARNLEFYEFGRICAHTKFFRRASRCKNLHVKNLHIRGESLKKTA